MAATADLTVVFLHFLGGSARTWGGVIAGLPAGIASLPIDLPGFGDAAHVAGYDIAAMADHVVARLVAAGLPGEIVLVGHSMGAKVAAAIARRAEDGEVTLAALTRLVLVAGSPPAPEPMADDKRAEMLSWFAGPPEERRREADHYIDENAAEPLPADARETAVDDVLRMNRAAWTAWLSAGSREDWTARVGLLRTPALLIAGDGDDALGTEAQRRTTATHFLNVRIATLAGASHLLPLERPSEVASLIADHIVGGTPATVPRESLDPATADLHASPRVSRGTRAVRLARLTTPPDDASGLLDVAQRRTLATLVRLIVPQATVDTEALCAALRRDLDAADGDGWRFAALPPDGVAMVQGLDTLEAASQAQHGVAFAALEDSAQETLLQAIAAGRLAAAMPERRGLDAEQMGLWFADLRSAVVRAYVAHPLAQARIGYGGFANGGDGPHKTGFVALAEAAREPWEPPVS